MSLARKFKRQAAKSQSKPEQAEGETAEDSEAPKAVKPALPNAFNANQRANTSSAPIARQQARRGTMRGK